MRLDVRGRLTGGVDGDLLGADAETASKLFSFGSMSVRSFFGNTILPSGLANGHAVRADLSLAVCEIDGRWST